MPPQSTCSVSNCLSPVLARGWCNVHYQHWKRHGDPLGGYFHSRSTADRFWSHVDKNGPIIRVELGQCWIWTASTYPDGYGQFKIDEHNNRAPRVAYELENGPIGDGLQVLHRCDYPLCVRPLHLFTGTNLDNVRDMVAKGRQARGADHGAYTVPGSRRRGEKNGRAKLAWADVAGIRIHRACGTFSAPELAEQYGVSKALIYQILSYRIWSPIREIGQPFVAPEARR